MQIKHGLVTNDVYLKFIRSQDTRPIVNTQNLLLWIFYDLLGLYKNFLSINITTWSEKLYTVEVRVNIRLIS